MARTFNGNIRENDAEWEEAVKAYIKAKKAEEMAKEEVATMRARLLELADGVPTKGAGIIVNSSNRKGTVQYAKIVKDYMKVLEEAGMKLSDYTGNSSIVWSISADRTL